jgi:hypothetical protein
VVADDLLILAEAGAGPLLDPAGESLVHLRPHRLGDTAIRRFLDQDVAERERVLVPDLRAAGQDQLLAH